MEQGEGSVRWGLVREGGRASQRRFCSVSTYDLPDIMKASLTKCFLGASSHLTFPDALAPFSR